MQHLTQEELKAVLAKVRDPLDKLMVLVTYWHGLRASETVHLTGANIQGGFVSVKRLKGSYKTDQPYLEHADPELDESAALQAVAGLVKAREYLFPSRFCLHCRKIKSQHKADGTCRKSKTSFTVTHVGRHAFHQMFKRAAAKAGLPPHKRHPHILKHTCAMLAIQGGIENCRQYLGHKSLNSTGAYLRVSDEAASASFAISARGGR